VQQLVQRRHLRAQRRQLSQDLVRRQLGSRRPAAAPAPAAAVLGVLGAVPDLGGVDGEIQGLGVYAQDVLCGWVWFGLGVCV